MSPLDTLYPPWMACVPLGAFAVQGSLHLHSGVQDAPLRKERPAQYSAEEHFGQMPLRNCNKPHPQGNAQGETQCACSNFAHVCRHPGCSRGRGWSLLPLEPPEREAPEHTFQKCWGPGCAGGVHSCCTRTPHQSHQSCDTPELIKAGESNSQTLN